jgi:hypothetical protein
MKHTTLTSINTASTDVETWAEAKFLAELDYELHRGVEFTVDTFTIYVGDDQVDHGGPVQVRLEKTDPSDVTHRVDEHLDPYWNIEVLSDHEGDGGGAWTFGPSYRVLESVRETQRLSA